MFITEQMIVLRAFRAMIKDSDVAGIPAPVSNAMPHNGEKTNVNGIVWFPETLVVRYQDGDFMRAYVGRITMQCREVGRNGVWWWTFGIETDGTLRLWAN